MNTKQQNNENLDSYQPPQSMQDEDDYPEKKVMMGYTILGTLCGMLISAIYLILLDGLGDIKFLLFTMQVVGGVAFLPALFTGISLAVKKFTITHYTDYLKVAGIGQLISTIYLFIILFSFIGMTRGLVLCVVFGLVGAISAVIVGKLILPKNKTFNRNVSHETSK